MFLSFVFSFFFSFSELKWVFRFSICLHHGCKNSIKDVFSFCISVTFHCFRLHLLKEITWRNTKHKIILIIWGKLWIKNYPVWLLAPNSQTQQQWKIWKHGELVLVSASWALIISHSKNILRCKGLSPLDRLLLHNLSMFRVINIGSITYGRFFRFWSVILTSLFRIKFKWGGEINSKLTRKRLTDSLISSGCTSTVILVSWLHLWRLATILFSL